MAMSWGRRREHDRSGCPNSECLGACPLQDSPPDALLQAAPRRGCTAIASQAKASFYRSGPLAEDELKPFLLKVAIVCEDLGEGMPAHGVHGNTVSEAIVLIRALFIQRETLEE